jgi:type II secretory pathway component PulC
MIGAAIAVLLVTIGIVYWRTARETTPPRPVAVGTETAAPASSQARAFPNIPLTLVGTTWRRNQAAALIAVENRPTDAYTVGQELASGIIVRSIFPDHVILAYGDLSKTLYVARSVAQKPNRPTTTRAPAPSGDVEGFRERNPNIDPKELTANRTQAAEDFLRDVTIAPNARGGFVVQRVEPESVYEKLGVRPGDVIYSIDTPGNRDIDESSMEVAMKQQELQLEVYRNGNFELLHTRIDQ